jgi:hypothetical protein
MKPIQRRAFIRNAGAAVAATAATGAATATAGASATAATSQQPLFGGNVQPSGEEAAIQRLHHTFVARLNTRQHAGLHALFASETATPQQMLPLPVYILGHAQHQDSISIAPDQQHATARFHCLARLEAPLSASASVSLLEMARQQGQSVTQWWEAGALESEYVKVASLWKINRISFHATGREPTTRLETPPTPASEPASAPC